MPSKSLHDARLAAQLAINGKPANPAAPFRLYITGNHVRTIGEVRPGGFVVYEFAKPHDAEVWFSGMPYASYEYAALFGSGFPPMPDWERIGGGWK